MLVARVVGSMLIIECSLLASESLLTNLWFVSDLVGTRFEVVRTLSVTGRLQWLLLPGRLVGVRSIAIWCRGHLKLVARTVVCM